MQSVLLMEAYETGEAASLPAAPACNNWLLLQQRRLLAAAETPW